MKEQDLQYIRMEVEAFYPGNFRGTEYTLTQLDLCARTYNEQVKNGFNYAPVVLGHPDIDHPRYGIIEKAYIKNGGLWLRVRINPSLARWIKEGYFRERSISFWVTPAASDDPNNLYLEIKHLGFLGAVHPELGQLKEDGLPIDPALIAKIDNNREVLSYSIHNNNVSEFITMDEQAIRDLFNTMFQENIGPIADSINQLRESIVKIEDKLNGGTGEGDVLEGEPAATVDDNAATTQHSSEFNKVTQSLNALRNDYARQGFMNFMNSPEIRVKMNKRQRELWIQQFNDLAKTSRAFAVGSDDSIEESESVKNLKNLISSLPDVVPLGRNVYNNSKASSEYDYDRKDVKTAVKEERESIEQHWK